MEGRMITTVDLDARLDDAATDPDRFSDRARELANELDTQEIEVEITDPMTWRGASRLQGKEVSLQQQFRAEVDAIVPLDREAEARLARRIEFARIRLELALAAAGLRNEALSGGIAPGSFDRMAASGGDCTLPPKVCTRWMELQALRTEMVERNLYLVLINVERYSHTTASQTDLIQEGATALFRAVDGFDWRRGLLFRTYAVHWLNQAFRSHLYNFSHTVRVPVYLQKALKHINDAKSYLGDENASVENIASQANLGENLVASALWASRNSYSLDVELDEDGDGGRLRDQIAPREAQDPYSAELEDVTLEQGIAQALNRLSERERFVISKRFGLGSEREHTLAEVAKELNVSLERVRQIQVRAINKMRTSSLRRTVDPFLN
jgi:RNA polymerase sigma factor (sigma-70 family)